MPPEAPAHRGPAGADPARVGRVVDAVRRSAKYRTLAEPVVVRAAEDALRRHGGEAEAAAAVRRRLHQVYGAFVVGSAYDAALAAVAAARGRGEDALRSVCARVMRWHASTAERLPYVGRLYEEVFALTGVPRSVLDAACGLNPVAVPWMGLPAGAAVWGCDVERRLVDFVDAFLKAVGVEGGAELRDLIAEPPVAEADVGFLLKSVPCLDRQRAGAGFAVAEALPVRWLVVSFPTRTLGGRDVAMEANYAAAAERWLDERSWPAHVVTIPNERVYVVDRGRRRAV